MADKCREVENTSGASYNKEIIREKSVKKEVKCEYREVKDIIEVTLGSF